MRMTPAGFISKFQPKILCRKLFSKEIWFPHSVQQATKQRKSDKKLTKKYATQYIFVCVFV